MDYEKFVQNQARQTRDLIDAVGLNWEEGCLAPELNQRIAMTASLRASEETRLHTATKLAVV